ncbi:unnamed protein product [Parnassius apollo]|uniref:(apollo) hypothetical protein n=1 Tax=Parnassius apollo TaxID=110799 RepID=A0A8S3WH65_PARAO|nr:unnamed protein product [Parnassius apollo]
MIVNQNRDTFEYIKSSKLVGLEVEHLKNSLEDQKIDVKCITQSIESTTRVDSIVSDICDMKNIVQELQAQIQNIPTGDIHRQIHSRHRAHLAKDRKINGLNKRTQETWSKLVGISK